MNKQVRVMIVDDHDMVRKGLKAYLMTEDTIDVVGEASSGNVAIQEAIKFKPDVILMDLIMEDGDGIEATKGIMAKLPTCKIIILTSYYDDKQVFPAIEAGAISYLLKTATSTEIVEAIYKAVLNKTVIDEKVATIMMKGLRNPQNSELHEQLTSREYDVLRLLSKGKSNAEIANILFIGIKTVKTHVSNILGKLEVSDRTQAVIYAYQHHLFDNE